MRSSSPISAAAFAALAVLTAPAIGATAATAAGPTAPARCPNGEVDWRIEGRISCAPVVRAPNLRLPPAVLMTTEWVEEASRRLPGAPPLPPGLRAASQRIAEQAARASSAALGRLATSVPARRYTARTRSGDELRLTPTVGGLPGRGFAPRCEPRTGAATLASKMWISGSQTLLSDGETVSAGKATGRLDATASARLGATRRLERVEVATTFELTRTVGGVRIEATVRADQTLGRTAAAVLDGVPSVEVDVTAPGTTARERRARESGTEIDSSAPGMTTSERRALERRTAVAFANDREIAGAIAAAADDLRDRILAAEARLSADGCTSTDPSTDPPVDPGRPGRSTTPPPTGPTGPGPLPSRPDQPGPTPGPQPLPLSFEGTITSEYRFFPTTLRSFTGTATYVRTSSILGPDGVTYAWYEMAHATVANARAVLGPTMDAGCRYVATGAGGTIEAGDLEIHAKPDGTAVYALHYDVAIPSTYLSTDCPPGAELPPLATDITALLDSRRPGPVADAFRPVGDGFELKATGVTDVAVSPAEATTTASWQLRSSCDAGTTCRG